MGLKAKLVFHTAQVIQSLEQAASQKMLMAVNEVRNTTLETLSGQRSGRVYKVPGSQRTYVASSPGEPPASRLGDLKRQVKTAIESEGKKVVGYVGTPLDYGLYLELGTKDKHGRVHILPRPWLKPSFEKALPRIKALWEGKWF